MNKALYEQSVKSITINRAFCRLSWWVDVNKFTFRFQVI